MVLVLATALILRYVFALAAVLVTVTVAAIDMIWAFWPTKHLWTKSIANEDYVTVYDLAVKGENPQMCVKSPGSLAGRVFALLTKDTSSRWQTAFLSPCEPYKFFLFGFLTTILEFLLV